MTGQDIELRSIVAVLRRQARVILISFFGVFALASLFLITVQPSYTATALVMVEPGPKDMLDPGRTTIASAGAQNARVDSEVELIKSSAVAMGVIADMDLISDPEFGPRLSWLAKLASAIGVANAATPSGGQMVSATLARFKTAVTIRRKGLTFLISVAVSSASPQRAADLANAVSAKYIEQQVGAKVSATLNARDALRQQIELSRADLAQSETAFDIFVARNAARLDGLSMTGGLLELNDRLAETQKAIQNKRELSDQVETYLALQSWEDLATSLGDQAILTIEAERSALLSQLADAPEQALSTLDIQRELDELEQQLVQSAGLAAGQLRANIQALEIEAAGVRSDLRGRVLNTDLPTDLLTDVYAIQQEASIARSHYQNLIIRYRDLETRAQIQVADSRLAAPALPPIAASFPNKALILLVSFAVATGIGVSAAFLNEYYIGGITTASQLAEVLQVPCPPTIPFSYSNDSQRLSPAECILDAPLSEFSESVRSVRAWLDQAVRTNALGTVGFGKVVLVTSTLSAEGKTTTALALARTYALAGKKTLLIDADLRDPSLHRHIGYEPQVGLLEFLQNPGTTQISDAFYTKDPESPLALIMGAAGSEVPTDQLLDSATFEALLKQAKTVYDVVIIDSPPVLNVVDARYIAHNADGVVFVTGWATTGQSDIRAAVQPLRGAMKENAVFLPVLVKGRKGSKPKGEPYVSKPYSAAT